MKDSFGENNADPGDKRDNFYSAEESRAMKFFIFVCLLFSFTVLAACAANSEIGNSEQVPVDWRSNWAVEDGFAISIDSEGYHYPTAIAFVPNPGQAPKDPLYFVTEVRGTIKVITNDRTVYTFAEGFLKSEFDDEEPSQEAEFGLAGICLEPKHGYVFVTFAYQDSNKVLRNNTIRFQTKPEVFSIKPTSQMAFTEIFAHHPSGTSHQIGPCQIKDDLLYVSVGDGFNSPLGSQQIDAMLGKIIRMTLDRRPVPDNPFYVDDDVKKASNYVWAYGLRNPFGLKVVQGRVFVADNGIGVDRFLEIQPGENYLWDGTEGSIAINAAAVLVPSRGPVQMDYYFGDHSIFPEQYAQKFFLALSGATDNDEKIPGIMSLNYSLEDKKMLSAPKYFLKYRGNKNQLVTGLAFGPDGLYFAPLLPNKEGRSTILKITYDPSHASPFTLVRNEKPSELMYEKGCFGCHRLSGQLKGGTAGPPLDREALVERLQARLNTDAYVESVKEIDSVDTEPQASFKKARQEVIQAEGLERVRVWMKYRIQEPKFDNLYSQMPNLGVTEAEAVLITDDLLGENKKSEPGSRGLLPQPLRLRHLVYTFVGGFFTAVLLWTLWRSIRLFIAKKRAKISDNRANLRSETSSGLS